MSRGDEPAATLVEARGAARQQSDIRTRLARVLDEHASRALDDETDRLVVLAALVAECEDTARYLLAACREADTKRARLQEALDHACLCVGCKAHYEEVTGEAHRKAELAQLEAQLAAMREAMLRTETLSTLAALRQEGYTVAVHNDYRVLGALYTFWLFTHPDGTWIKGEGASDGEALEQCRRMAELREGRTPPAPAAEPHMIVTWPEGGRWFASCACGKVEGLDAVDARRAMEARCKERFLQQAIATMGRG